MDHAPARRNTALDRLREHWELLGQITTWLLGSVAGFLQAVPYTYPPESDTTLSLGSFVVRILVGLIFVPMQIFRGRRHTSTWFFLTLVLLGIGLWAFFRHQSMLAGCIVDYRGEKVLKGRTYTNWANEKRRANPQVTDQDLLEAQNVTRREKIWTPESIEACRQEIQVWYIATLPAFVLCVMS